MNIEMGIAPRNKSLQVGGKINKGVFTGEYTKAVEQLEKGETLTVLLNDPDKLTINRERQRLKFSCQAVENNSMKIFSLNAHDNNLIVKRRL